MINIDIQELKHLYYYEEKSAFKIAQHFQTSPDTIIKRMKKHGLQRRSYAEAQKLRYANIGIILNNINEIVRLYFDEELTLTEVGERIGVSHTTIKNRLEKAGYKCRKQGASGHQRPKRELTPMFTESELTEIKRLYSEAEKSFSDIALQYGCCDSTIRNYLKRIGVQTRTIQEAQAVRRKKEEAKTEDQHQASVSRQLKQLPPLTPEQVTPDRVLELRHKRNLTIDAIAELCSLTNLEIYNILQAG